MYKVEFSPGVVRRIHLQAHRIPAQLTWNFQQVVTNKWNQDFQFEGTIPDMWFLSHDDWYCLDVGWCGDQEILPCLFLTQPQEGLRFSAPGTVATATAARKGSRYGQKIIRQSETGRDWIYRVTYYESQFVHDPSQSLHQELRTLGGGMVGQFAEPIWVGRH
jgi:hypothetical protein